MLPNHNVQASTGAIPKSISFDKSADKEEENIVPEAKHGTGHGKRDRSFFKSWKLPKIGRRGGGGRGSKSEEYLRSGENHRLTGDAFNIPEHAEGPCLRRAVSDESKTPSLPMETSDDILAKYRKRLVMTRLMVVILTCSRKENKKMIGILCNN